MFSTEKKFIFIHPQKCAGTSVRHVLRNEYSNGVSSEEFEPEGSGHWRVSQWFDYIGDESKDYFKFGVIRNPWDRAVSYYHHLKKHQGYKKQFWQFVLNDTYLQSISYAIYTKFHHKGEYVVDFVLRQENFSEDLKTLVKKLGIENYQEITVKHGTDRPVDVSYREFYKKDGVLHDDLIDQIASLSHFEIEKYGYEF
jgi:hypothetical protein